MQVQYSLGLLEWLGWGWILIRLVSVLVIVYIYLSFCTFLYPLTISFFTNVQVPQWYPIHHVWIILMSLLIWIFCYFQAIVVLSSFLSNWTRAPFFFLNHCNRSFLNNALDSLNHFTLINLHGKIKALR